MKSPRPKLTSHSLSLSGSSELSDLIAKARSEFSQTLREVSNSFCHFCLETQDWYILAALTFHNLLVLISAFRFPSPLPHVSTSLATSVKYIVKDSCVQKKEVNCLIISTVKGEFTMNFSSKKT